MKDMKRCIRRKHLHRLVRKLESKLPHLPKINNVAKIMVNTRTRFSLRENPRKYGEKPLQEMKAPKIGEDW